MYGEGPIRPSGGNSQPRGPPRQGQEDPVALPQGVQHREAAARPQAAAGRPANQPPLGRAPSARPWCGVACRTCARIRAERAAQLVRDYQLRERRAGRRQAGHRPAGTNRSRTAAARSRMEADLSLSTPATAGRRIPASARSTTSTSRHEGHHARTFSLFEQVLLSFIVAIFILTFCVFLYLLAGGIGAHGAQAHAPHGSSPFNSTVFWQHALRIERDADEAQINKTQNDSQGLKKRLEFHGYDCSVPYNATAVTVENGKDCNQRYLKRQQKEPRRYLLLQESHRIPIKVKECRATFSRLTFQCGAYGHAKINTHECWFGRDMRVDLDMCKMAHERNIFERKQLLGDIEDDLPKYQKLRPGVYNNFHWPRLGWVWPNSENNVLCQGQVHRFSDIYTKGHKRESKNTASVVTDYVNFWYQERKAYLIKDFDDLDPYYRTPTERIQIDHNQMILPKSCKPNDEECIVNGATYYWENPTEGQRCSLFRLRQTDGVDVQEAGGHVTYISKDDSMIRLTRKRAVSKCGLEVYATEFDQLFLSEYTKHPPFARPLPDGEGSAFLYANQKLHFVYHELKGDISNAVLELRTSMCEQDVLTRAKEYARRASEQRSVIDGDTVHIKGQLFATSAGETWWVYTCRPLLVTARSTPGVCYDALPVDLRDEDLKRMIADRRRQVVGQEIEVTPEEVVQARNSSEYAFFLEPKSHRLTGTATADECFPPLPPLYQNRAGEWIAYHGTYSVAKAPEVLGSAIANLTLPKIRFYPEGGIYDGQMVKRFERHQQSRRAEQGLVRDVLRGMQGYHLYGQQTPSSFYENIPGMPSREVLNGLNAFHWFWVLVDKYSTLCALTMGTMILWRFLTFLTGVLIRLCSVPHHPNPFVHVLGAFFPSITERLTQGRYRPRGAVGPCHELADAMCRCQDLATPDRSDDEGGFEATKKFQREKERRIASRLEDQRLRRERRQYRRSTEEARIKEIEAAKQESENVDSIQSETPLPNPETPLPIYPLGTRTRNDQE